MDRPLPPAGYATSARLRWRRVRRPLLRLGQIGMREYALLGEATLHLLAARTAIATLSFAKIARRLGGFMTPAQARATAAQRAPGDAERAIAREIGWAVTSAARHVPVKLVCLPQAMAARAMLRRRGIASVLHFGTTTGGTVTLEAHAWLDVGEVEVTGYPVGAEFTEIACLA